MIATLRGIIQFKPVMAFLISTSLEAHLRLLNTGLNVGGEIASTRSFNRENIRKRLRESVKHAAKDGLSNLSNYIDQQEDGRKRVYKKRVIKQEQSVNLKNQINEEIVTSSRNGVPTS